MRLTIASNALHKCGSKMRKECNPHITSNFALTCSDVFDVYIVCVTMGRRNLICPSVSLSGGYKNLVKIKAIC